MCVGESAPVRGMGASCMLMCVSTCVCVYVCVFLRACMYRRKSTRGVKKAMGISISYRALFAPL